MISLKYMAVGQSERVCVCVLCSIERERERVCVLVQYMKHNIE